MNIQKSYPYILIIGSIIGLLASFVLTIDFIKIIENPNVELPCNINPFISCSSVASTWQNTVFGFPNSILGIMAFSILLTIGIILIFGASNSSILDKMLGENRAQKPFWLLVNLGTLVAMIFVMWFFYQSVYNIGSLCIYCMTVWVVTWPIFLYTTVWNIQEGHFNVEHRVLNILNFVSRHHIQILVTVYLIAIFLILFQFKDFFLY
ncbi:MAG: vitamin K epoxide reductase [Candidatus Zambryskibacteria bacterium CG10_big_fil_rev_8_21_14_0_10_34_34]|uniref:Vitamin K epoxide reductase n=1 Tax=Candidatus Zambryskibacteria bacterium CG10_big_fil_rev_8_21_14_0_10_34_34 TaxID=1975114 RepID=A0A2H0R191_9BACT|nr:MAG: vitamin K epoxide reductase [Candidatus Zambryskibacteria bacterium CG10_big_fil_rev_8_21_14_0_10_34_34]